jgi:hypothetical protein
MNHHTNEVRRIVANFHHVIVNGEAESRLYPFSRETRLFIVGDKLADGTVAYSLIGDAEWSYRLFDQLCDRRVVEAEFGRLLVDGKRLSAEKYLALWREAEKTALSLDKLIAQGITPVQHLALPTVVCKKSEHAGSWYASPLLIQQDETCTTWEVPLDDSESHLQLAGQLRRVYWGSDMDQAAFRKEILLKVDVTPKITTPLAAVPVDLFAEVA